MKLPSCNFLFNTNEWRLQLLCPKNVLPQNKFICLMHYIPSLLKPGNSLSKKKAEFKSMMSNIARFPWVLWANLYANTNVQTKWLNNSNKCHQRSLTFSPEDQVTAFWLKLSKKRKEKLNMNGQIVHNKINMHLENRENFHFMPTLNVSVFLTQS